MIDWLESAQRDRLAGVVRALQGTRLRHDSDRFEISERILRRLA
jgi:hypothetical protein